MKHGLIVIAFLAANSLAFAGDKDELHYDQVSLSAESSENVENDTVIASLYAQQEGNDPTALSRKVNETIEWAISQAKQYPTIELKTLSYTTQPTYQKSRLSGWRVKQSIQIKSKNIPALSELVGKLQSRISVQSISYSVSDELRRSVEDRLITGAIKSFEARADLIGRTMDRKGYQLVDMDVMTANMPGPRPSMRMSAMSDSAVAKAPSIVAGTQKLKVTVRATIQLNRD